MGILICDKKPKPNNKPQVITSNNKFDVENNSTNATEKNNNNNNNNANPPLREQPTNDKLENKDDIKDENNNNHINDFNNFNNFENIEKFILKLKYARKFSK